MLTLSQQVIFEDLAKKIVQEVRHILKTKPIQRKSVRTKEGKVTTSTFSAPVSASGKLASSVRFEVTDTHINIYGESYIYTLIYGRKPTKNSGSGEVSKGIRKWISSKNISSDISENQLVYLISRKIHKYGNSIYLFSGSNNSGLLDNVLNDALKREFKDKFTREIKDEVVNTFNGN